MNQNPNRQGRSSNDFSNRGDDRFGGHDDRAHDQDARGSEGQMGGQYGAARGQDRDSRDHWTADSSGLHGDYYGSGRDDQRYGADPGQGGQQRDRAYRAGPPSRGFDSRDQWARPDHDQSGSPYGGQPTVRVQGQYGDQDYNRSGRYGGMDRASGDEYGRGAHGPSRGDQGFDPDYQQWRNEQMRQLDNDYLEWRRNRYQKFSEDFNQWRQRGRDPGGLTNTASTDSSETAAAQAAGTGSAASSTSGSTPGGKSK